MKKIKEERNIKTKETIENELIKEVIEEVIERTYKEEFAEEECSNMYKEVRSVERTLGMLHAIANLGLSATVALYSTYGEEYFDDIYLKNDSIVPNKGNERDISKILDTIYNKLIQNKNIVAKKFGIYTYTICYLLDIDYDDLFEQGQTEIDIYGCEESILEGIVGIIEYNGDTPCSFEFEEKMMEAYLDFIKQTALGKAILETIDQMLQ